jgi:hypothetical protein
MNGKQKRANLLKKIIFLGLIKRYLNKQKKINIKKLKKFGKKNGVSGA